MNAFGKFYINMRYYIRFLLLFSTSASVVLMFSSVFIVSAMCIHKNVLTSWTDYHYLFPNCVHVSCIW